MPQRYKNIPVTEEMLSQIQSVAGAALTAEDVVVFEATAANTRPVSKRGSIHNKAVITRATLMEMAERLNAGQESVPLHTMHQAGSEMPVGKVFKGWVENAADGQSELRVLFYLSNSETGLIEKINLGMVDEVSIGLMAKHLFCSKCGFDYLDEKSDFMHLFEQTCSEGHTIGVDGTHLITSGVDSWSELSLVSRGAIRGAKIHGQKSQHTPHTERLAASGFALGAVMLSASPEPLKEATVPDFDPAPLTAAMTSLAEKITSLEATMKPAAPVEPPAPTPNPELVAAQARVAELEAELAEAKKVKPSTLIADVPTGGLSASAVADATKTAAAPAIFKSPRKA